ncbi:MAG: mannose-1-phosphate guanylyltransferase [Crocinitomicaceae bacterium]
MKNNYCVIMAGGIGSRFWPLSTSARPKQFLDVLGMGKSLIRMTYERMLLIAPAKNIFVVTNTQYIDLVKAQIPELSDDQIMAEPLRKNTAPCIAYAAAKIHKLNPNANLVVAPSDHLILQDAKFERITNIALEQAAKEDCLVTLGIKPSRADTGYGYIQFFESGDIMAGAICDVKQFTEKPNKELAELFLKSGDYYWNSGIFVWKTSSIINALQKFRADLYELFVEDSSAYYTDKEEKFVAHCFEVCEDISIDFAVMENAKNVKLVLADFDWSDLGTWGSLYTHMEKDVYGNAIIEGNARMIDSHNCIVNLPSNKLALIQGLNNHIIVESDNVLLILNQNDEQKLKDYLKPLKEDFPEYF